MDPNLKGEHSWRVHISLACERCYPRTNIFKKVMASTWLKDVAVKGEITSLPISPPRILSTFCSSSWGQQGPCWESRDEYCGFKGYPFIQRVKRAGAWLVRLNFESWKNEVLTVSGRRRSCRTSVPNQKETASGARAGQGWEAPRVPRRRSEAYLWMLRMPGQEEIGCCQKQRIEVVQWGREWGRAVRFGFTRSFWHPMLDLRLSSLCPHTESLAHFFWKIILWIKIGASQMVCPQALNNLMSLHFQLTQKDPWGPE